MITERDMLEEIQRERQRSKLSKREQQVCAFLCGGKTTKGTALALGISPKTVEGHRANIFRKLGINDMVTLVKWAIRCGLTTF